MIIFSIVLVIILCGASRGASIDVDTTTGIQNAINQAHNGDTLNLSAGTYYEHDIAVNKNLTITGPQNTGTGKAVIDAQKQGRVFNITNGANVILKYLTITNGNASKDTSNSYGGGIYNNEVLVPSLGVK